MGPIIQSRRRDVRVQHLITLRQPLMATAAKSKVNTALMVCLFGKKRFSSLTMEGLQIMTPQRSEIPYEVSFHDIIRLTVGSRQFDRIMGS